MADEIKKESQAVAAPVATKAPTASTKRTNLGGILSKFGGSKSLQGKSFGGTKLGLPKQEKDITAEAKKEGITSAVLNADYGKKASLTPREKAPFEGPAEDLYDYGYYDSVSDIINDYKSRNDSPALFISEMMDNPSAVRAIKDLYEDTEIGKQLEEAGKFDSNDIPDSGVEEATHDYAVSKMFKKLWDSPKDLDKFQKLLKYHAAVSKAHE